MVTIIDKEEEAGGGLPPTYEDSVDPSSPAEHSPEVPPDFSQPSSSTAPAPPSTPLVPPTNFLTIERSNKAIKGTYAIDPTMTCPPGVKPSVGGDGKYLHMRLASTNGSVDAVVEVIRGPDAKGPARLEAETKNSSVTLRVYDRHQNHFRLRAASTNGSIKLHIPSAFVGTVSTRMKNGSLKFSPAVQARLTTFSERDGKSQFFIGDYAESGYENDETWLLDHLCAEAHNGSVKISFIDEDDVIADDSKGKGSTSGKGFFNRIFGS